MTAAVRAGVVWCPHWPVVAAGFAAGEPVAVMHANRVVACSPAASHHGVALGMRRRPAQARCPALRLVPYDRAAGARAFEAIAHAVSRLVPRLEIGEPGVVAFAARGPSRYFGGDGAMAERVAGVVVEALHGLGSETIPIGVGVADGRFSAAVAARHASAAAASNRPADPLPYGTCVVPPGESASFLAPAPVELLYELGEASAELVDVAMRLGLATLGHLAALPAADVLARFGEPGAHAHRLAGGGDDRMLAASAPSPPSALGRSFDEPVQQLDTVVFAAKQLGEQLVDQLAAQGLVCTRLVVRAETDHGERSERVWYRPSGLNAAAIVERVRWQLEGWVHPADRDEPGGGRDGPTGGVVLLRLEPEELRADNGAQLGFWGGRTQADEWAARAVARVSALVGERKVLVPAWRGGRLPHDAVSWVPAALCDLADPSERLIPAAVPWPGQIPAPSPAITHARPIAADVRDATGDRVRVCARGVVSAAPASIAIGADARIRVTAWAGPWPMDERWWRGDHRRLARFQLLTADRRAYLVAVEKQRWWVIGQYA